MELVLATTNVHKVREFRDMIKAFGLHRIDILSLHQFPSYVPPAEEGLTFQEIAKFKAIHAAKHLDRYVLADDSGLVVPALGGKPGILSKRFAGEDATDAENRTKLLHEMASLQDLERSAYYECCLALADASGMIKSATGLCEGRILIEGRGGNGYSYDSLFVKNDYDKSFGELDETTKNRVSHRHKAFERLVVSLESIKETCST